MHSRQGRNPLKWALLGATALGPGPPLLSLGLTLRRLATKPLCQRSRLHLTPLRIFILYPVPCSGVDFYTRYELEHPRLTGYSCRLLAGTDFTGELSTLEPFSLQQTTKSRTGLYHSACFQWELWPPASFAVDWAPDTTNTCLTEDSSFVAQLKGREPPKQTPLRTSVHGPGLPFTVLPHAGTLMVTSVLNRGTPQYCKL